MASSPPASPGTLPQRPLSAMVRPAPRSNSRMSMTSKAGGGSRASDEDGKTSVKVAVRVRPPLKPTDPGYDLIPQRFQRSMVQVTSNTSLAIDAPQGRKLFVFDRVFGPETNQDGIWEYVSDCVNCFIQGYNVSLLAYGQSGAGKSYTMGTSGPAEQGDLEMMGVIPRAATALFEKLEGSAPTGNKANRNSMSQLRTPARYSTQSPASKGEKSWSLKATYVEIYNEQLRDLLIPENVPQHERAPVTIREDVKGNILLTGLRQVEINSVDDLLGALNFGSTIRQTDATAINAKSSRSHAVFSLNLVQRKNRTTGGAEKRFSVPLEALTGTESWITTDSKLHFVDLAGSERLKNTGAHGERAKEGISINAGLAALGKVISQLSSRQPGSHVSYRDSRLTRLLQDSLGGNAITYMIACVTPAEFHLSETLNTVQYAQRARAIQSKPRIQQVEEGDKQAIIDRLKAEVAFLREQIRSAERGGGGDRRMAAASERSERTTELQNQLLEAQENYTALSKRHAKLIAEMARARDNEAAWAESQQLEGALGDTATERLNRSNSFAQAVEQVVLEYEKTIQSLEQSLSRTRTTLSNTETSLLEKETRCAYIETTNAQLQARLQKMMEREASTENYLHDLEAKLDGHTSGEEKNATIIMELRKEIARVRENEAACEDYISTLEERLAEADQDAELMQRELNRLEQLVERQRSLGKLDSLLYELDHIQQDAQQQQQQHDAASSSGVSHHGTRRRGTGDGIPHSRSQSHASRQSHRDVIHESSEEDVDESAAAAGVSGAADEADAPETDGAERQAAAGVDDTPKPSKLAVKRADEYPPQSPAQSKFVQDKLENVTQELIDLRVEHESTLNEYDLLHAKYEEALRALAEMQDALDEVRHPNRPRDSLLSVTSPTQTRPSSFLSDAKDGGQHSSSRSLSSELSSAMESPATVDTSDAETAKPADLHDERAAAAAVPEANHVNSNHVNHHDGGDHAADDDEELKVELARLKALAAEKEVAEKELTERYARLEQQYQETLDMVEELKTEVAKAKTAEATSPRGAAPVIRRKSSQNVMIIDRAHRSFAALRNIAADNFEENVDVMQNFELNLNAAMHELHARSERIQELEADLAAAKREMEIKMQIISGLTRERSSLKTSPVDMSVVSTLRDQLEKSEKQLRTLQEAHTKREQELLAELESLRAFKEASEGSGSDDGQNKTQSRGGSAAAAAAAANDEAREANRKKIAELEAELASWEDRHQSAISAMAATEQQMRKTIEELEARVSASVNGTAAANGEVETARSEADAAAQAKQEELVAFLRSEIEEYKSVISMNQARVAELEAAHEATRAQLGDAHAARERAAAEGAAHRALADKLKAQIAAHEEAIASHEESLRRLKAEHERALHEGRTAAQAEFEARVAQLERDHAENVRAVEAELTDAREELMKIATQVAFAVGLDVSVERITERIDGLVADRKDEQSRLAETQRHMAEMTAINERLMRDLEAVKSTMNDLLTADSATNPLVVVHQQQYPGVTEQLAALRRKMADLEARNKKNSRLVEQLEDQLQSNYDQVQLTNNRLSTLQTEKNAQLEEANATRMRLQAELDALREEYAALQAKFEEMVPNGDMGPKRSNSINSHLRKSASVASLPSPPPSMPLPPLPATAGTSSSPTNAAGVPSTPTGTRPASKSENSMALTMTAQIQEDQEARIRTIEKHLFAERQLTSTLEEALTDLERQSNKVKADADQWRRRCQELEAEIKELRERPREENRWSMHQVEEERKKRRDAELAARHLEERMNAINKKKKKGSLNCF